MSKAEDFDDLDMIDDDIKLLVFQKWKDWAEPHEHLLLMLSMQICRNTAPKTVLITGDDPFGIKQ